MYKKMKSWCYYIHIRVHDCHKDVEDKVTGASLSPLVLGLVLNDLKPEDSYNYQPAGLQMGLQT